MVFKMLILLGFFADGGPSFIHSDIHRGFVDRVDYPVHNLWFLGRAMCASLVREMRRNVCAKPVITTDWNGTPPFVFIWLQRFLIAEEPIRNGVIREW